MEVHHQRVLGAFGPARTTSPISKFAPVGPGSPGGDDPGNTPSFSHRESALSGSAISWAELYQ